MQLCRKQCFLVFEMLPLRFSSLTCCCYLHIQPSVFMCDICHWSNSLQLSNCFCLFPLAGKLIEYNWMVMCFSWVLLLVDIGVLYALCNKSVSLFIRVPCSKIAGLWHCLACEGTKWESSGQDFCVSFSLELPEIPWALAPFRLLWEQCMFMLHTKEIRERLT